MKLDYPGLVVGFICLSIVLPVQTVIAEPAAGNFDAREVELGELDPRLTAQGWELLTKRAVLPSVFTATEPETIQISTNNSNALIYRSLPLSGLQTKTTLTWEWRVESVSERISAGKDPDWPVVVYAAFDVDKQYVGWWRRWLNKLTFSFAGLPPSGKILTYVWSMDESAGVNYPNPYIPGIGYLSVLRSGQVGTGDWVLERRNLFDDFSAAFGHPAERVAFIAISADSEDTRSTSLALLRNLRLE